MKISLKTIQSLKEKNFILPLKGLDYLIQKKFMIYLVQSTKTMYLNFTETLTSLILLKEQWILKILN